MSSAWKALSPFCTCLISTDLSAQMSLVTSMGKPRLPNPQIRTTLPIPFSHSHSLGSPEHSPPCLAVHCPSPPLDQEPQESREPSSQSSPCTGTRKVVYREAVEFGVRTQTAWAQMRTSCATRRSGGPASASGCVGITTSSYLGVVVRVRWANHHRELRTDGARHVFNTYVLASAAAAVGIVGIQ